MNWHDKNKSKTPIDLENLSSAKKLDDPDLVDKIEAALGGGEGNTTEYANVLTDTWLNTGKAFSPNAMHLSAIRISREVTSYLIERDVPASALLLLALSFQTAAVRLIKRAEEIDPKLAKQMQDLKLDK